MRAGVRRRINALKRAWANRPKLVSSELDFDMRMQQMVLTAHFSDGGRTVVTRDRCTSMEFYRLGPYLVDELQRDACRQYGAIWT